MPKRILVVEDNLDTRELMHLHLTTAGFSVILASDGHEGLYLAEAELPDLIITDINMPQLDGITLIKELRSRAAIKAVPIIALSAYGAEELETAIGAGASLGVRKPTLFDSLIDDITKLLSEATGPLCCCNCPD